MIEYLGEIGLFADLLGYGWFVLTRESEPAPLSAGARAVLDRLDARVLRIGGKNVELVDVDGRYAQWLADLGADTVVIRPDFYLYAAVAGPTALGKASEQLGQRLCEVITLPA